MFKHARLGVGAIQQRDLVARNALANEIARLVDNEAGLVEIGKPFENADRFARTGFGPQAFAEAPTVMLDDGVGGFEDIAVRAVVLLQADNAFHTELAFEVAHVADLGATKGVDRLVVVTYRKQLGAGRLAVTGEQLQPFILQHVRILELIDQDVAEARLVVLTQRFVAHQQFIGTQQQLGKIQHPLALTLALVLGIKLDAATGVVVVDFRLGGADTLLLVRIDEVAQLARRKFLVVDVEIFKQTFDCRQLISRIEDLEQRRQARLAVMRAQKTVAQAVECADPHAAGVDRQHRREACLHFASRLVGKGHRQNALRPDLPRRQQPGDARSKHSRLATPCTSKDQRMLWWQGDGGQLRRIEIGEQIRHGSRLPGGAGGIIPDCSSGREVMVRRFASELMSARQANGRSIGAKRRQQGAVKRPLALAQARRAA